ncbi:MAG: hypothetical protein ACRDRX_26890 [Pseudonocardiaceae bacterium]
MGRILADSTWHHHFDINLRGIPGNPDRPGFVTPGTSDWITTARKIEYYYVNAAIWLASPAKQAAMRAAAWWPALWSDHLLESIELVTHLDLLGRRAYEALSRYAPQCIIFDWIWSLVPPSVRKQFPKIIDKGDPTPLIEYVAGVATRQLLEQFDVSRDRFPTEAPSLEEISRAFTGVAERALAALLSDMEAKVDAVRSLSVQG